MQRYPVPVRPPGTQIPIPGTRTEYPDTRTRRVVGFQRSSHACFRRPVSREGLQITGTVTVSETHDDKDYFTRYGYDEAACCAGLRALGAACDSGQLGNPAGRGEPASKDGRRQPSSRAEGTQQLSTSPPHVHSSRSDDTGSYLLPLRLDRSRCRLTRTSGPAGATYRAELRRVSDPRSVVQGPRGPVGYPPLDPTLIRLPVVPCSRTRRRRFHTSHPRPRPSSPPKPAMASKRIQKELQVRASRLSAPPPAAAPPLTVAALPSPAVHVRPFTGISFVPAAHLIALPCPRSAPNRGAWA